eukprot:Skav227988  [mRNA]  locus=scaffold390:22759:23406:+ [translate_table: standard]
MALVYEWPRGKFLYEREDLYEWALLPGSSADEMTPELPRASAWASDLWLSSPGPGSPYIHMEFKDGPLVYCHFDRQLQDNVWIYKFDPFLPWEEPRGRGRRGGIAVRPIPSPLVLNCDFSLANRKHFEAVCFNLAGREVARVQTDARVSLTMEQLAQIVRDVALGNGALQSRNQQVRVLMNGSENLLAKETFLFDWLMQGGQDPNPVTTRERKAS